MSKDRTKSKRSKQSPPSDSSKPACVEIADYRHKGEKRKNIPDAGLATYNSKSQEPVKYSYDPHLDPQLIWAGKSERTSFEVETVSLHIHERVSTQAILKSVEKAQQFRQLRLFADPDLPFDKRIEFYQHEMDWTNRLILGDSLLVMNSLKERELMEGKIQTIYMDPPYGINYSSNFQSSVGNIDVSDKDDDLTREPEQIKAYRDTWTLGIHSYLTYLRDRLLLCKDLLHESGSIFIQISEDNLHRVRLIMDEVFGAENFVSVIPFRKKLMTLGAKTLESMCDYLLWYGRNREKVKYHPLYSKSEPKTTSRWTGVELPEGTRRHLTSQEAKNLSMLPQRSRVYSTQPIMYAPSFAAPNVFEFEFQGKMYSPPPGQCWITSKEKLNELVKMKRLEREGEGLRYIVYHDDFPYIKLTNMWSDTVGAFDKIFVVQTSPRVIERCILMTSDPGDLVFDPTCGSGTTAYVAEQWGRRWITCDTSRVALALARQRLLTASLPFYKLTTPEKGVDGGFEYETVSHITMKSLLENNPKKETLYDNPTDDKSKVRVSGPFTVEAIPMPVQVESPATQSEFVSNETAEHVNVMIGMLQKDGVTFVGGKKMVFENLRPTASGGFLHSEGEVAQNGGKIRVAISFGPKHGPITARQVDEAMRSSYRLGFDALVLAGFAFEPEAQATIQKNPIPKLRVHMAHISPDVIVGDLLKTTRGSQLFTVFGEPDIKVEEADGEIRVILFGVDVYDPLTGEVHSSSANDIPAWFLDDDYDGYTFRICQAFFPKEATAKNPWDRLENALRGIVDEGKMEMFRGTRSSPFKAGIQKQIAVKVIDSHGNEVMVVKSLNGKELT